MFDRVAPFLFVLLWSSSFVAAKVGLQHISPLLFVAVRLAGCAVVLIVLMLVLRRPWAGLGNWRWLHCGIAGALLNAVGLMAPHVGLLMVPAAQIALVQSLTPLLTALLGVVLLHEHLRPRQWLGLVLGMAGVGLVVGHAALDSPTRFTGLLLAFVGVLGLVAGTLYFGRFCRGVPLLPGATAQFMAAAAGLGRRRLAAGNAARRVDDGTVAVGRLEHSDGLARRHGAVFRHARSRHRRSGQREFLSRSRNGGLSRLGCSGRGADGAVVAGLVVASAGCWLVSAGRQPRA